MPQRLDIIIIAISEDEVTPIIRSGKKTASPPNSYSLALATVIMHKVKVERIINNPKRNSSCELG